MIIYNTKGEIMRRYIIAMIAVFTAALIMSGCGETLTGLGKDVRRVGRGVKTIFVRED